MEAEKLRCERARSIVQWLIKNGYATNQKCLAKLLGYNHAALSQILNGKVPMSGKFMNTLCSKNSALNRDWLETGEGEMFVAEQVRSESDQIRAIIDGNEISGNSLVNILSSQSQAVVHEVVALRLALFLKHAVEVRLPVVEHAVARLEVCDVPLVSLSNDSVCSFLRHASIFMKADTRLVSSPFFS